MVVSLLTGCWAALERPNIGWRIRTETTTRVWSAAQRTAAPISRYSAAVRTFVGGAGAEEVFGKKTVGGTIARPWV